MDDLVARLSDHHDLPSYARIDVMQRDRFDTWQIYESRNRRVVPCVSYSYTVDGGPMEWTTNTTTHGMLGAILKTLPTTPSSHLLTLSALGVTETFRIFTVGAEWAVRPASKYRFSTGHTVFAEDMETAMALLRIPPPFHVSRRHGGVEMETGNMGYDGGFSTLVMEHEYSICMPGYEWPKVRADGYLRAVLKCMQGWTAPVPLTGWHHLSTDTHPSDDHLRTWKATWGGQGWIVEPAVNM